MTYTFPGGGGGINALESCFFKVPGCPGGVPPGQAVDMCINLMGFPNIAIILRILLGFFQVFYVIFRDFLGFSKILGYFQRFFLIFDEVYEGFIAIKWPTY